MRDTMEVEKDMKERGIPKYENGERSIIMTEIPERILDTESKQVMYSCLIRPVEKDDTIGELYYILLPEETINEMMRQMKESEKEAEKLDENKNMYA